MSKRRKWTPRTPAELEAMKKEEDRLIALSRLEQEERLRKFRGSCPRIFGGLG